MGAGGSGGPRPSDKRGGGHLLPEKKGGGAVSKKSKKFFGPQFGLKQLRRGGGCPGPSRGSATGGFYNREFTVVNRSPTIANNIRGRGRLN